MPDHAIAYRERRGAPLEQWALHAGTRAEATDTAVRLLASLKEESAGAMVYVDGRRVRQKGGVV